MIIKFSFLIFLVVLFTGTAKAQSLADYKWKKRVLVLVGLKDNAKLIQQQKTFLNYPKELEDRNLVLVQRLNNDTELNTIYAVDSSFEGVLLIGKDGGIKLSEPFPVTPKKVFDLIDSMPMRRAEMRNH